MKIGVFGDSYAKWRLDNEETYIWWTHFQELIPGCQVTSYGCPGSSIDYSLHELLENHQRYDFVIWCVTGCFRRGAFIDGQWYHFQQHGPNKNQLTSKPELPKSKSHVHDEMYAMFKYTWQHQEWRYKACVDYALKTMPHLMVIPCFEQPLETGFCLTDISRWEWNHYFPDLDFSHLHKTHKDLRHGHLTRKNQRILAELIANDLKPGIFHTDLKHFQLPDQPIEECFSPL